MYLLTTVYTTLPKQIYNSLVCIALNINQNLTTVVPYFIDNSKWSESCKFYVFIPISFN